MDNHLDETTVVKFGSLPDSRVVLMCGVSGSGKTVCSREYVARGYVRVSADEILWREYGDSFPMLTPETKGAAFAALPAKVEREVAHALADGRRVVVDSTMCRRAKRDAMRRLCRDNGAETVTLYFDVPLDELRRRVSRRRGTGPDDQIVPETMLARYFNGFERPARDEEDVMTVKWED